MKDLDTLIREGKITEEEARRLNNPDSRRSFLKKTSKVGLGLAAGSNILFNALCSKPEPPNNGDDNGIEYQILTTWKANYTLEGTEATGIVKYYQDGTYNSDTNSGTLVKQANLGVQAELGSAKAGVTVPFDVVVEADGGLRKVYKNIRMSKTEEYYDQKEGVLQTAGFNLDDFIAKFLLGDRNDRWRQHNLEVYFNPDIAGTGKRLPQDWIDETKRAINKIKDNSAGFIQSVNYHEDGNYTANDLPPPNGACWVFKDSEHNIGNATYPDYYGPVDANRLMFNSDIINIARVEHEAVDGFWGDNQNPYPGWEIDHYDRGWLKFSFMRPAGDESNYRITKNYEVRDGIANSVSVQSSNPVMVYAVYQKERTGFSLNPFADKDENTIVTGKRIYELDELPERMKQELLKNKQINEIELKKHKVIK